MMATPGNPYPFPDLGALQQLLAGQDTAQGEMARLKAQQAEADLLRGSNRAQPMPGTGGVVSPIAAARDAFKHYQGNQLARETQAQLPAAVTAVSQGKTAADMHKLRQARALAEQTRGDTLANRERLQGNFEQTRGDTRADRERLQGNFEQERADRMAREQEAGWSAIDLENEQGERRLALRKGNQIVDYHTKEPVGPGWFSRERPFSTRGGGMGGLGVKEQAKVVDALAMVDLANAVGGSGLNLPQRDIETLNSSGQVFKRVLIGAMTPADFTTFLQQKATNLTPAGQQFMTRLNAMSAEERHRLFGAALTGNENVSADKFLAAAEGLSFEEILNRLQAFTENKASQFRALDARHSPQDREFTRQFSQFNTTFGEGGLYEQRKQQSAGGKGLLDMTDEEFKALSDDEQERILQGLGG